MTALSTGMISLATNPFAAQSGGDDALARFVFAVLKPPEAAQFLGITEEVLAQEVESGRVPGRKLGGEWRFLRLALIDWLHNVGEVGSLPKSKSSKERMLAAAGIWKDDPTVDAMMEEIYRERKRHPVGGRAG